MNAYGGRTGDGEIRESHAGEPGIFTAMFPPPAEGILRVDDGLGKVPVDLAAAINSTARRLLESWEVVEGVC